MGLRNLYNSAKEKVVRTAGSISDLFSGGKKETRETSGKIGDIFNNPPGSVNPSKIADAIHYLESSRGLDPNTPKNIQRSYTIPPMNANEKERKVDYMVGAGGQYGLTPSALSQLAKSTINREAGPETFTKFGRPLIPGKPTNEIQELLMTPEGAGQLAVEYFNMKRANKENYTPEQLANDYVDYYVGKGEMHDTPQNRKRALDYFNSLLE